jgi:hypothetical protein
MATDAELLCYKQVPRTLRLAKSRGSTMATSVDNIVTPWLCVHPPEYRAEILSLEARRMLVKLGELHQLVRPRPAKNPGAAWGSTCLDGPCMERPNMVLEVAVLHRGRSKRSWFHLGSCESTLAKYGTPQETFWGWSTSGCVAAMTLSAVEGSKEVLKLEESLRRALSV